MTNELKKIKILFLEDNPDDVELELYELQKGGFDVMYSVARNQKEFFQNLNDFDSDIIIADYSLPDITGFEAIHICKEEKIDAPVILITGMGNEQVVVDSLREGAADYILKKNIAGLPARVERALDIWADRKAIRKIEVEKQYLHQQLLHAQKMESVGLLAGGIAHDFNNLLTGIIGYAGLSLNLIHQGSPVADNLQNILDLSDKAANLVKSLLLFSRKIPLEFSRLDINSLLKKNIDFMKRIMEETIEIKLQLQDNLPLTQADETQLTQVLINLAVNARDSMEGDGFIKFKTEKVTQSKFNKKMTSNAADEYICISVSDTGCGIKKETILRIFEPFYTTKEVGKGTGLGLAVAYSIITGHGGWIDVKSKVRHGTTFKVFLPVHAANQPEIDFDSSFQENVDNLIPSAQIEQTILVVEDEDMLRKLTIDMLESFGYRTMQAKDGLEALEIYKNNQQQIGLVFSDMVMPKKSGLELFHEIKELNSKAKFVLVTGYSLDEIQSKVFQQMDATLLKPYSPVQLADLIRKALAH